MLRPATHKKMSATIDFYLDRLQIAAGCFGSDGYGRGISWDPGLARLDGIVLKTTSREPIQPDRRPRFVRRPDGNYWNWAGLRNPGLAAIESLMSARGLNRYGNLWLSLYSARTEDYSGLIGLADRITGLYGYELNLSCPNLATGRLPAWPDLTRLPAKAGRRLRFKLAAIQVREVLAGRLDLPDGSAAVIGNSRPNRGGGLSGPILRPEHCQLITDLKAARPDLELVGCGGVETRADIDDYLRAGSSRVQVGAYFRANGQLPGLAGRKA